jgi:GNAT superfamily N-acetyltransferase
VVTVQRIAGMRTKRWHLVYHLFWAQDPTRGERAYELRPDSRLYHVGHIEWILRGGTAQIVYVNLEPDLQGLGLGRELYRQAINDLVERRKTPLSDVYRSAMAERVWSSLIESNPGAIESLPSELSTAERAEASYEGAYEVLTERILPRSRYYEVTDFIERRPKINVRRYRRRA